MTETLAQAIEQLQNDLNDNKLAQGVFKDWNIVVNELQKRLVIAREAFKEISDKTYHRIESKKHDTAYEIIYNISQKGCAATDLKQTAEGK